MGMKNNINQLILERLLNLLIKNKFDFIRLVHIIFLGNEVLP